MRRRQAIRVEIHMVEREAVGEDVASRNYHLWPKDMVSRHVKMFHSVRDSPDPA